MKVLLSGGVKTENILSAIRKKFTASGDEFIVEKFIDDVGDIYARGDYFDKAIVTEQSITKEYSIKDEGEIRRRINQFAIDNSKRQRKALFVFLTQNENIANMIYEEILPILNYSAVVYKQPPYSVQFFVTLVLKDVKQLPEDIVFKPQSVTSDIEYSNELVEAEDETKTVVTDEVSAGALFGAAGFSSNTDTNDDLSNDFDDDFESDFDSDFDDSFDDSFDEESNSSGEEFNDNNDFENNFDESDNSFGDNFDNNNFDNNNDFNNNSEFNNNNDFNNSEQYAGDFDENTGGQNGNFDTEMTDGSNDNYEAGDGYDNYDNNGNGYDNSYNAPEDNYTNYQNNDNVDNYEYGNQEDGYNNQEDGYNNQEYSNTDNSYNDSQEYNDGSEDNVMGQQYDKNGFNNDQYEDNQNQNFIPGFDEDEYTDENNQEDLFSGYTDDNGGMNQGNMNNSAFEFNNEDYSQSEFNNPNMVNGQSNEFNQPNGFDQNNGFSQPGAFDQPGMYDANPQQNIPTGMGFDQSDYDTNGQGQMGMNPNAVNMNAGMDSSAAVAAGAGLLAGAAAVGKGLIGGKKGFIGKSKKLSKVVGGNAGVQQQMQGAPQIGTEAINGKHTANVNKVRNNIKAFAARGNSIVVTGCGGCGTSTIAYNLANIICQLGYTVLLVDMDTDGRTQNYISRVNYESMESDGANLMAAVNSSTGLNNQMSVVKQGFHLLTMGIGADVAPVEELLHKEKLGRFINMAKVQHNFVIYDIPFNKATTFLSDVTYGCDNIVLAVDSSNWGITKMMLNVCNIASEDMQDTIFNRAQVVFNRYRNLNKVFGKRIRTASDIMKVVDDQVLDLIGDDPGFYFQKLTISGIINDDPAMEDGWFENVQYSDTRKGQNVFLELLQNIVLKK